MLWLICWSTWLHMCQYLHALTVYLHAAELDVYLLLVMIVFCVLFLYWCILNGPFEFSTIGEISVCIDNNHQFFLVEYFLCVFALDKGQKEIVLTVLYTGCLKNKQWPKYTKCFYSKNWLCLRSVTVHRRQMSAVLLIWNVITDRIIC